MVNMTENAWTKCTELRRSKRLALPEATWLVGTGLAQAMDEAHILL